MLLLTGVFFPFFSTICCLVPISPFWKEIPLNTIISSPKEGGILHTYIFSLGLHPLLTQRGGGIILMVIHFSMGTRPGLAQKERGGGMCPRRSTYGFNRFDAVSAYMCKMDHYGLSDFLKISHIR